MLLEIKNYSRLMEVPYVMENACRDNLKKIDMSHTINKTINSLDDLCSRRLDIINKMTIHQSIPKYLNY